MFIRMLRVGCERLQDDQYKKHLPVLTFGLALLNTKNKHK